MSQRTSFWPIHSQRKFLPQSLFLQNFFFKPIGSCTIQTGDDENTCSCLRGNGERTIWNTIQFLHQRTFYQCALICNPFDNGRTEITTTISLTVWLSLYDRLYRFKYPLYYPYIMNSLQLTRPSAGFFFNLCRIYLY